jgi:hypothetical protein
VNCPSERLRRLYFAGLGVVFVMAFASLWVQFAGLFGEHGIVPAQQLLEQWPKHVAGTPYENAFAHGIPTLFWFGASDGVMRAWCGVGIACGGLLALGFAPLWLTALCGAVYLSFVNVGDVFLGYQWDALLLETAALSLFYAPTALRPWSGTPRPPTRAALWALRLLLFRFMFSSGAVKLLSGDEAWRDFTALTFHYWTQPLPTRLGWFAQQLPLGFQKWTCVGMFAVELGASWLVFLGRWGRRVFALSTAGLMAAIAATGNYGFFEPLTVVLCLPVLADDPPWPPFKESFAAFRRQLREFPELSSFPAFVMAGRALAAVAAACYAMFALTLAASELSRSPIGPPWLRRTQQSLEATVEGWRPFWSAVESLERFRAANTYGLFAVMTKSRPSLEIQGSDDLAHWKSYVFRWKENDDLTQPPLFCEPHMPRLDWQMWFEALARRPNPWFRLLLQRLLEGEPAVLALLAENPFPDRPPRFVRAVKFDYEFTTAAERHETGQWWKRRETAIFHPPVSRR